MRALHTAIFLSSATLAWPLAASAQDTSDLPGETSDVVEILVTGTKASAAQKVQDIPVSVTAVGGATIENQGIRDLTELGYRVPNVRLQPTGLNPGHASYAMRGIGTNSSTPSDEPVVVTVVDGMVLGTSVGAAFQTFDLEAVEIYRGPQGILFGKNSTGGVINVRSRRPSGKAEVSMRALAGSYNRYGGAVAAETPLIGDVMSARIAATYEHQGGYFRDLSFPGKRVGGGAETFTIRPTINLALSDRLEIDLLAEFFDYKGDGGVFRNLSDATIATTVFGVPGCVVRGVCRNRESSGKQNSQHFISEINYDFGQVKLTSVTAFRQFKLANRDVDSDATVAPIVIFDYLLFEQNQFSQETRLAGELADGRLSFVTGLLYFDQGWRAREGRQVQTSPVGAVTRQSSRSDYDNSQLAGFGQATFKVTPSLSLIAGGRYTHETKQIDLAPLRPNNCLAVNVCSLVFRDLRFRSNNFSPKLGVEYRASDDILLYGSWTRGFRAGGYNSRFAFTTAPAPYDDEKVDAYEAGVKSDLLDGLVRLNVSYFHNEFSNLQRTILKADSTQDVVNAAAVTIDGVEVESSISPAPGLRFDLSGSYTDARYESFNDPRLTPERVKTLKLERAPKWTFNAGANYEFAVGEAGKVTTAVNYSYTSRYIASTLNDLGFHVPKLQLIDATIAYEPNDRFKISLFGKNLKDEIHGSIIAVVSPLLVAQTVLPPRTFGVQLDFRFR